MAGESLPEDTITSPGWRSETGSSASQTVMPAWRPPPRWRAGVVAAAVGVALAVLVALLVTSQHAQGPPPAGGLVATLADPARSAPDGLAFQSDTVLVITDNADNAYDWDIASRSPTAVSYASAAALILSDQDGTLRSPDGQLNVVTGPATDPGTDVVQVQDPAGRVVFSVTAPRGSDIVTDAFSPGSTELAVAESNGRIYVYRISGQA